MEQIGRKALPHQPPWSIDPANEIFFITICAQHRSRGPLLPVAAELIDTIRFRHDSGIWWTHLAVIMPDHVHMLLSFRPDESFATTVRAWKNWTARACRVAWQKDFFDHRLRHDESYFEKADYILWNPVRAGLVTDWKQWPHFWMPRE